jgi:hypothetical protein
MPLLDWFRGTFQLPEAAPPQAEQEQERRRMKRIPRHFDATLDLPGVGIFPAKGVNWHYGGAMMKMAVPVRPGTVLLVHLKSFGMIGWAVVRHCVPTAGGRFGVGVEFNGPLMEADFGKWEFSYRATGR